MKTHTLEVCGGPACRAKGARLLLNRLARRAPLLVRLRVIERRCLGICGEAPAVIEDGEKVRRVTVNSLDEELERLGVG